MTAAAGEGRAAGSCCVAYVAVGKRYRDEAMRSLASVRRYMPGLPVLLFTDAAEPSMRASFEEVVLVENSFAEFKVDNPPWGFPGFVTRIEAFLAATAREGCDRTLFLDTDIEVTGDISGVFRLLDRFDIAVAHAPYRYNEDAADIPDAFPEFNVGVVAVRRSQASLTLLPAWRVAYLAQPEWWHNDQVAFRRAVWETDVRVATLPPEFNFRPARYDGKSVPRILHGFARSDLTQEPGRRIRLFTTDLGQAQPTLGWEFALRALGSLTHPNGVLFDSMVDNTFGRRLPHYRGCLPHSEPWIGLVHNPPDMPDGDEAAAGPESYCAKDAFRRSLPNCLGLFALSESQAEWFRHLGVPVEVVPHPVDLRLPLFSEAGYRRSAPRQLLQIGTWLQRPESFSRLACPGHKKILLGVPGDAAGPALPDIEAMPFRSAYHYEALMQRSVVFADVTAAAAHPALLECLARATPIVVNRHPAIVEQLGAAYPLFYESLDEASALLASEEVLIAGHRFLADPALRSRHSGKAFVEAMLGSRIYRGLPHC
jgi:hypothetical protein